MLTKNCVWSVNEGFDRERTEWTIRQQHRRSATSSPNKKLTFDQIVDIKLAKEAVEAAGGRVTISNCKDVGNRHELKCRAGRIGRSLGEVRTKLDQNQPFNNMRGTPYYRDAVYEQFSAPNTPAATRRCAPRCATRSSMP